MLGERRTIPRSSIEARGRGSGRDRRWIAALRRSPRTGSTEHRGDRGMTPIARSRGHGRAARHHGPAISHRRSIDRCRAAPTRAWHRQDGASELVFARAVRFAIEPLRKESLNGYRPEMDGDGDGIACEPYHGRQRYPAGNFRSGALADISSKRFARTHPVSRSSYFGCVRDPPSWHRPAWHFCNFINSASAYKMGSAQFHIAEMKIRGGADALGRIE